MPVNAVLGTIQGASGGLVRGIGAFIKALLAFGLAVPLLMAALCWFVAADGSMIKGTTAAVIAALATFVAGVIYAVQYGITQVATRVVSGAGVGEKSLTAIFDLLPVSPEAGWTLDEFESGLESAAERVLGERSEAKGLRLWFAWRAHRLVTWATVRVILKRVARDHEGNPRVDAGAVRDALISTIDELVVEQLTSRIMVIGFVLLAGSVVASLFFASTLRFLPF